MAHRSPVPFAVEPDDRGQATVLVAVVVVLAAVMVIGIARLGSTAVDRARARTAADAAALAGAADEQAGGGRRRAESVAGENGATIESYRVDGSAVEVGVQVGSARATSRADVARVATAPSSG